MSKTRRMIFTSPDGNEVKIDVPLPEDDTPIERRALDALEEFFGFDAGDLEMGEGEEVLLIKQAWGKLEFRE